MGLWTKKQETPETNGEFEEAAARVTAAAPEVDTLADGVEGAVNGDRLEVRPEWAEAVAKLCFLPAARLSHPAYALSDEEAQVISPKMQAFLQAVADKYAPAMLGRVASKYPELFDLTAALGVLYFQKWRYVSAMQREEARIQAEAQPAPDSIDLPGVSLPLRPDKPESKPEAIRVI